MGVYIDTGNKVKHYCTDSHKRVEKALITILDNIEDMVGSETHDGYECFIRSKSTPLRSEALNLDKLLDEILKAQTYKLFENDTELYLNRDTVISLIKVCMKG